MPEQQNIERLIIIGMISSTDFLKEIHEIYSVNLIESVSAKRIATWCIEYFDQYNRAPDQDIEGIYFEKIKNLPKDLVEDISGILSDLSEEATDTPADLTYLIDQTRQRFTERHLFLHQEKIQNLLLKGRVKEAAILAVSFKPLTTTKDNSICFADEETLEVVEKAFTEASEPLLHFPKQLGKFLDHFFIPASLIGIMGASKRGKTFLLLFIAELALLMGKTVAFFQAGDMSENQQVRRFCIFAAKRSDKAKYCEEHFQPMRDCVHNQRDTCNKKERECSFGVFESFTEPQIRDEITIDQLKEAYNENPTYLPCWNCSEYQDNKWGAVWIKKIPKAKPIEVKEAKKIFKEHYIDRKKQLRLSSHPNGTLTKKGIDTKLDYWEKKYNFIPEIILIDYAELLEVEEKMEERSKQNTIWKQLRNLSQTPRGEQKILPCVIAPTQTDANSYEVNLLRRKNFSEDKRKYDHCTVMIGLNGDPKGREKAIGIMRFNIILARDEDFDENQVCYVLQNLRRGQPILSSYF